VIQFVARDPNHLKLTGYRRELWRAQYVVACFAIPAASLDASTDLFAADSVIELSSLSLNGGLAARVAVVSRSIVLT
jgi:hypothetical protein